MAPKKSKAEAKGKKNDDEPSSTHSIELSSRNSQCSQRNRARKYTKEECEMLVKICDGFFGILSKNSNRDADVKIKKKTWETIKRTFDVRCRAEAIYVRLFIFFFFIKHLYFACHVPVSFNIFDFLHTG